MFEQRQFQPQLSKTISAPNYKAADYTRGFEARDAWLRRGEQEFLQSLDANSRIAVENAGLATRNNDGKALQQLAAFSQTLLDVGKKWQKKSEEDERVGQLYDGMFGDYQPGSPEAQKDEAIIEQAQKDNEDITQVDNQITEETGNPVLGNAARAQLEGQLPAAGYRGEIADLTQAQTLYAPYLRNWVNDPNSVVYIDGQAIPVRDAIASGNPALIAAAIAAGRYQFMVDHNLGNASKAQVIAILGNTIRQVDSQMSSSLAAGAVEAKHEEARQQVMSGTYASTASVPHSELGRVFQDQSNLGWTTGGFASRGKANEAVLGQMLQSLIDKGDVDGIRALAGVQKIPGQKGTELGSSYARLFAEAEAKAERKAEILVENSKQDIQAGMFERLAGAQTDEQRSTIIEESAVQLEQIGDYEAARALRQQRDELTIAGNNQFVAAELSEGIASYETTPQMVNEAVQKGNITPQQGQQLLGQIQQRDGLGSPDNPIGKDFANDWGDRFETSFLQDVGYRRDPNGNLLPIGDTYLDEGVAGLIVGQAKRDINIIINSILQRNPNLANDPLKLQQVLTEQLNDWWKANVLAENGKFYVEKNDLGSVTNIDNLEGLVQDPVRFTTPLGNTSIISPQNYTNRTNTLGWTSQNRNEFNPVRGDKVFGLPTLNLLVEEMKNGEVNPILQTTADALGMTPLALLNQQMYSNGMQPLSQASIQNTQNSTKLPNDITTPVGGAQALMSLGLPTRGAAWLSGNIQQESSWDGQRSWGEVMNDGSDRNGGLVSWMNDAQRNHFRLTRIEEHLGKPIDKANDVEQLQAMLWEMKTYYPEAYRIFFNPNATDRQLIRASKLYWGYGHQGSRYQIAQETLAQL